MSAGRIQFVVLSFIMHDHDLRSVVALALLVRESYSYKWPAADEPVLAQRTAERVAAGKHAAKQIACDVCHERFYLHYPSMTCPLVPWSKPIRDEMQLKVTCIIDSDC
eukprot:6417073-Amphidinium_carterae.1